MGDEARLLLIAATALVLGLAAGWVLARLWRPGAAWALAALLAIGAGAQILAGQQAQGFRALGHVIAALYILAPAMLGAALGGWLGGRRR